MSGLCPTVSGITKENFSLPFTAPGGNCVTCKPGWENIIDSSGRVVNVAVETFVANLLSTSRATAIGVSDFPGVRSTDTSQPNPANDYAQHAKVLRQTLKDEYCYYYSRYMWGMQKILVSATQQGSAMDPTFKNNVQKLNNTLNIILAVMKGIVNSRMAALDEYSSNTANGVNSLNAELDTARTSLQRDSTMLQKNDLDSDIQSSMIEFSLEKNESSRNMLAMYGFMNIVAVGLLFYLYTNIK
jgi:hypothetical protein